MAHATWTTTPFVIHVNEDPSREVEAARKAGALVRPLALSGLRRDTDLFERAASVFEIPYPVGGPPGLIDWLSDLEWLGVGQGALLVFDADQARPKVVGLMARLLPYITERWSTGPVPFVAYLVNVFDVDMVRAALNDGNDALDRAAARPWSVNNTGAVAISYGELDP